MEKLNMTPTEIMMDVKSIPFESDNKIKSYCGRLIEWEVCLITIKEPRFDENIYRIIFEYDTKYLVSFEIYKNLLPDVLKTCSMNDKLIIKGNIKDISPLCIDINYDSVYKVGDMTLDKTNEGTNILKGLEMKLKHYLSIENYEMCSKIRDKIKKFKDL